MEMEEMEEMEEEVEEMEEEGGGGVCDPYCIFCGSVVLPKKKTFLEDPNFPAVWKHLCAQMKVPTTTRDSLLARLQRGEGTFCTKTCRRILSAMSKILTQISSLEDRLEEKTTEIRNRVIAASALDSHAEGVDEESLVYSFRLLISRHFKVIKRHTRKSGPCPRSKKSSSSVSKTKKKTPPPPPNKTPPDAPEVPPPNCGMTLRNKSLPAVELKEEWETDTDDSDIEAPSTTEDMDCSASPPPAPADAPPPPPTEAPPPPPTEEESAPPPPKRKYKFSTPRETSGSLRCPKCSYTADFASSAQKPSSRRALRSHYHAEHFYKKLVSREDLQKTPHGEDFFACPTCPFRAVVNYNTKSKNRTQANREHRALSALRNHFLQSHEGEPKITGRIQTLHSSVGNSVLPEFNPDSAEENVDFFKCPFGGCGFISQVIDPHAKYPKGQEHRRLAILRVARHYLKFHEDLVNFEKTRRNPAVVRDPETQGEILKCPKCEFKLEYICYKKSSQDSMTNQLKFTKHYASHILPFYTSKPNLYQKERTDE